MRQKQQPVTIYQVGYHGLNMDKLCAAVRAVDGVLVDVRRRTGRFHWKSSDFRAALESRYVHLRGFGNRNYRAPSLPIELHDPTTARNELKHLIGRTGCKSTVLMCACEDYELCHRKAVVEFLKASVRPLPGAGQHAHS